MLTGCARRGCTYLDGSKHDSNQRQGEAKGSKVVITKRGKADAHHDGEDGEIGDHGVSSREEDAIDQNREEWTCCSHDLMEGYRHHSPGRLVSATYINMADVCSTYSERFDMAMLSVNRSEKMTCTRCSRAESLVKVKCPNSKKIELPRAALPV